LAVPATDKPIKWTFANAPKPKRVIITPAEARIAKRLGLTLEQYAQELIKINEKAASKPKRSYTKRSKYWNSTNVKTKMSKARKARKTSKSK
jgi:hypothetical protein